MDRHVGLLSRLYLAFSAFIGIVGVAVATFGAAAALIALEPVAGRPGTEVAAGVTAATLFLVAFCALLWAAAHYASARGVGQRRGWARLLALALAAFDILLVPLGTALGLYAIWVLLHDDTRRQFPAGA